MDCVATLPGSLSAAISSYLIWAGLLAVPVTIFWIRRRWAAREAAGYVQVAYWWEAIVHALAVVIVIVIGFGFVMGFAFR